MTQLTPIVEHPPLLPPGLHIFSLENLRRLCVDRFPNSATRESIMKGLEAVIAEVEAVSIDADIWVNGSFLTHKENPKDSDIVIKVKATLIDQGTDEQKHVLQRIKTNLRNYHLCDSYIMPIYPDGDPLSVLNDYHIAYWLRQFGFSRGVEYKGVAVLRTGATQ